MIQIPIVNPQFNNTIPKPRRRKWIIIIIIVFVIIFLLFVALVSLVINSTPINNPLSNADLAKQITTITPERELAEKINRPHIGNIESPLVIVEFSDFQCPVCKREFPIIREIVNRYSDDILYIYRQYPIIDENSPVISQASLCANEQGKFWQMHDKLFLTANIEFSNEYLNNIAKQSGLKLNDFTNCLESKKYENMVIEDVQDGFTLGVKGTPTFFVNGQKLEGAVSLDQWDKIITELLDIIK